MRAFVEGRASGHLLGGTGFEQIFLQRCHEIRAQYGSIGDELSGRMPLAYAHIVQVSVDVVLWLYPVMSFSSGMVQIRCGGVGVGIVMIWSNVKILNYQVTKTLQVYRPAFLVSKHHLLPVPIDIAARTSGAK